MSQNTTSKSPSRRSISVTASPTWNTIRSASPARLRYPAAVTSFSGSPSVRWISPPIPTARACQYAEYPKPDPSSITRRAPTDRASTSSVTPTLRPTIGKPRSFANASISSSTGSSSRRSRSCMYASMRGSTMSTRRTVVAASISCHGPRGLPGRPCQGVPDIVRGGRLRVPSTAMAQDVPRRVTDSGIELEPLYGPADRVSTDVGEPGSFPFTRGVYPNMYRGRLWTMRQYAGMGTAEETNRRFRYLLDHGQTGLSVAFDLPTQMGLDSDHPRAEGEVGATAAQEIGFTLANGIAYLQAAVDAGLAVDDVAPRLSFFFACHLHFFEEVAKFRAARRLWARIVRERFGATDPRSLALRFHTQTGGATLTAQQPENNIVRTALEAMAAVLGGTQSLHTNSIHDAAYRIQRGIESGERIVVGVNRFVDESARPVELQGISEEETAHQLERLRSLRGSRDGAEVDAAIAAVEQAARGSGNLLDPMRIALKARATLGEVSDALRRVFGEYRPSTS